MQEELIGLVKNVVNNLYDKKVDFNISVPDEQFGDLAINVALILAPDLNKNPKTIADAILGKINLLKPDFIESITTAGPGFINIKLTDKMLINNIFETPQKGLINKIVVVEFGQTNPFKEMHLGHLYTSIVGDVIARLYELQGATVHRVSYHGDIGLHIAKTIWAIRKSLDGFDKKDVKQLLASKDKMMGEYYVLGAKEFEENDKARDDIKQINAQIYNRDNDLINNIYELGLEISFNSFDKIFQDIGVTFNKRYLESDSAKKGLRIVNDNIGNVFTKSQGAIVFQGENQGLHTRVFINSQGLPTYETKDLGLAELKNGDYPKASKSVIITDHQQEEYFKVMLAALSKIDKVLANKTTHIVHGHLGLTTGKMSSRSGNVFAAENLISDLLESINNKYPDSLVNHDVFLAALKYSFLKTRIGSDIIFDISESVTIEGNSGPYLQYAHARARSILAKVNNIQGDVIKTVDIKFDVPERTLLRKLSYYQMQIKKSVDELRPHYICTYLYELTQIFNRFYENCRVVGDERQEIRLSLVLKYAETLKSGLALLGIPAPDKM